MSFQTKQNLYSLNVGVRTKEEKKLSKEYFTEHSERRTEQVCEQQSFMAMPGGALGKVNGLILSMRQKAQIAAKDAFEQNLVENTEQMKSDKVYNFADKTKDTENQNAVSEAVGIIDRVIKERSSHIYRLESLQRRSLQSNLNKLLVAAENLTAARSTLQDLKLAKKIVACSCGKFLTAATENSEAKLETRSFLRLI